MDKASNPEVIRVNDLMGLVSRKVRGGPFATAPNQQVVPAKAPPSPLAPNETSWVARSLSVYNGWIPFDTWLNRLDTTWNQCSILVRIFSGQQKYALVYLLACELPEDMKTAAYLRGKMAAMECICLLRQIFIQIQQDGYSDPSKLKSDATRLIRFIDITADIPTVIADMISIAQSAESFDEFQMRWVSTFAPVNNLIHARRIIKSRVKRVVLHECHLLLHQRQWEANFGMYYFLGVMSRLDTFDLHDPHWNEDTLRPLRKLFFLFSQVDGIDFAFTRHVFKALVTVLHSSQSLHLEEIYIRFIAWLLYKSALREKKLIDVIETICIWEKQLDISLKTYPQVLAELYHELPYYDLPYAEREVRKVVVIVDLAGH